MKKWLTTDTRTKIYTQLPTIALVISLLVGVAEVRQNRQAVHDGNDLKRMEMIISQAEYNLALHEYESENIEIIERGVRGLPLVRDLGEGAIFTKFCALSADYAINGYKLAEIQNDSVAMTRYIEVAKHFLWFQPACKVRIPISITAAPLPIKQAFLEPIPEGFVNPYLLTDEDICDLLNTCKKETATMGERSIDL